MRAEAWRPVRANHRFRDGAVDVAELNLVGAGAGEQPGDESADLAGAEDEYAMHDLPNWPITAKAARGAC